MAYCYHVTFRIADKTIGGKTYSDRYAALIDALRNEGMGYWEETTSFFLVESPHSTPQVAAKAATALSAQHDMFLVYDPSDMSASYFGPFEHVDVLKGFLPKLKKLP
jgi:hypothetical protein